MHRRSLYQSNVQWSWPFFNFLGLLPNFFQLPSLYLYISSFFSYVILQFPRQYLSDPCHLSIFVSCCHPFWTIFVKMWEGLRPSLEKFCLKSIFGKDNDMYGGGWRMTQRKNNCSLWVSHMQLIWLFLQAKKRKNRLLCKFTNCKIK